MKEPLTNKSIEIYVKKRVKQTDLYYPEKEIKSAVEWLKGRMLKIDPNCTMDWDLINVLKMIDEAFEDVVNQKTRRRR
jgi:hypothetical protein